MANSSTPISKDSPQALLRYRAQGRTLEAMHRAKAFVRIVIGPLGSAKTFSAINDLTGRMHNQVPDKGGVRRSRWCVARNTMPNLKASTIPDCKTVLDKLNPDGWSLAAPITWTHKYDRADGTKVEMEIMFRAFDGPQDVVDARGMQLTGIWVDELAEFDKSNFDMLIGRVKRYPARAEVPGARFHCLATSNACPRDHWLAKIALAKKAPPNWWIGIQPAAVKKVGNTWVENPQAENIQNLAKNYYKDQLGGKKESWIRQNLANEFVYHGDGRPVHPEFNEAMHVAPAEPTYGLPLYVGLDFGRTPAAVILQRQHNGQWYVLKELCETNMGADRFAPILKRFLNDHYPGFELAEITGDPSGTSGGQASDDTPFLMLNAAGLYAQPAHTNDPEVRFAVLDQLLDKLVEGKPMLQVDPSCTTLIRGLAGEYQFYRIQVVGREEYRDKQDKGPTSHVCEALHYGLLGAGEGDILFSQEGEDDYGGVESWSLPPNYFE